MKHWLINTYGISIRLDSRVSQFYHKLEHNRYSSNRAPHHSRPIRTAFSGIAVWICPSLAYVWDVHRRCIRGMCHPVGFCRLSYKPFLQTCISSSSISLLHWDLFICVSTRKYAKCEKTEFLFFSRLKEVSHTSDGNSAATFNWQMHRRIQVLVQRSGKCIFGCIRVGIFLRNWAAW